jgi:hypothetical protein
MLKFQCHSKIIAGDFSSLIIAGWTGRNIEVLNHHIEELAKLGVPRPSTTPIFYRTSVNGLTQTTRLQVLGQYTSGEVEPVLFGLQEGIWLGVGSDHTDRKAETMGIALSKQLCGKVVGTTLWPLADVVSHWDELIIRSWATIDGKRAIYQEGKLATLRTPADLLNCYDGSTSLQPGAAMFCGTVPAIGGIRTAARFEMELDDPILEQKLTHAYDIVALPEIH